MERITRLMSMLEDDPNDSFVHFAIAMEYKSNDHIEKAIEKFEELRVKDSDYVGLYYHLGKCYEELDDDVKAMGIYNTGIKIAENLNDHHAKSELLNEKTNLELGL